MSSPSSFPPNVIVFFTDQQRWDTAGVHGNPLGLTPNFDRMAASGTHFANALTPQPLCSPARSCLQTGQYATTTGVFRNRIPMREDAGTLARSFSAAGYATGYIGKWHLASAEREGNWQEPVPPELRGGYDYWLAADATEFLSDAYDTVLLDNGGERVRLPGYRVDATVDAGIRYVDQHQAGPFLLFLSFLEPHHQNHLDDFPAPSGYRERYTGRWTPPDLAELHGSAHRHLGGYYGMVKRLDEALGRLLDALKSLELLHNTIVVFTSDHGCHFKTRNDEYKRSCHESSIRIPAAAIGPGFDGGGRVTELFSLVDVMPTLLEAANIPIPESVQGLSAMPLIRGEDADWPEERLIQISETEVGRAIRTARWKYAVVAPDGDPYQDAGSNRYAEQHLYDLHADPYELVNLVGMEPYREIAAELREKLCERMVDAGERRPAIDPAPRRPGHERRADQMA